MKINKNFTLGIISFVFVTIFFWPSIISYGKNAGFIFTGDFLNFYIPSTLKLLNLYSEFNFIYKDVSHFNGSSQLAFVSNLFALYPPIVILGIFANNNFDIFDTSIILIFILWLNIYISFFYSLKLADIYLKFDIFQSIIFAIIFSLSIYVTNSLGQPEFIFSVMLMPAIVYLVLKNFYNTCVLNLLFASVPIILSILGGYVPLAAAMLLLALIFTYSIIHLDIKLNININTIFKILGPFTISIFILSPFLIGVYDNFNLSPSANAKSLFFSAHQLSELPYSFINFFSISFGIISPFAEFTIYGGLIFVTLIFVYLFKITYSNLKLEINNGHSIILVTYLIIVLSIYGDYSVVSDLIYYFIPQIGSMHIYQRFLFPANLFFSFIIVKIILSLVDNKTEKSIYFIIITFYTFLYLIFSILLINNYEINQILKINNFLLFEIICVIFILFAFISSSKNTIYILLSLVILFPALDRVYGYAKNDNSLSVQKNLNPYLLDENLQNEVINYFKSNGDNKELIKYIDLTPMWDENGRSNFPKSFPYAVLNKIKLSSYHGFNFYLSPFNSYYVNNPVIASVFGKNAGRGGLPIGRYVLSPDLSWALHTGADFIIFKSDQFNDNAFAIFLPFIDLSTRKTFSKDINIVKIKKHNFDLFNNGIFKLSNNVFKISDLVNISKNKHSISSSFSYDSPSSKAFDGVLDGDFYRSNSVFHSAAEQSPWIQVDLEKIFQISQIKIYNRSDCCPERLNNYTIFISEKPINPNIDFNSLLLDDKVVKIPSHGSSLLITINTNYSGRFVRLQINPSSKNDNILNIAELEIYSGVNHLISSNSPKFDILKFNTNFAGNSSIILKTESPLYLNYLLSIDKYSSITLNGKEIKLDSPYDPILLDAGTSYIDVCYDSIYLKLHWLFILIFTLFLVFFSLRNFLFFKSKQDSSLDVARQN